MLLFFPELRSEEHQIDAVPPELCHGSCYTRGGEHFLVQGRVFRSKRAVRMSPRACCTKSRGVSKNKKQCSRQLQCEVPCGICFISGSQLACQAPGALPYIVYRETTDTIHREGHGEGCKAMAGGKQGISGPGCLHRTTTRCLP